eukprot:scaffold27175_cov17-Tisochrysis_lutea.AAC.2
MFFRVGMSDWRGTIRNTAVGKRMSIENAKISTCDYSEGVERHGVLKGMETELNMRLHCDSQKATCV